MMMSITVPQAYKRLVILLAHMFYSGQCPPAWWIDASEGPKKETQAEDMLEDKRAAQLAREARRKAQADTTGLGIIILTALTERQWVEEDEFARSLNLPPKMVRKAMRFLEEEQLVMREHRKETKRARREERNLQAQAGLRDARSAPAAAAAGPGPQAAAEEEEEEEAINVGHVISYCALDYPRIVDSVRWRINTIKNNLLRECRNNSAEQRYKCPKEGCGKEYSSMDVFDLMDAKSHILRCGICTTPIELLLADGKTGTADERKEKIKRAKELLHQYDTLLGPLIQQLNNTETITAPDFSNYHTWLANQAAVRSHMTAIENGTANGSQLNGPAPKPVFTANTQVVLSFDSNKPSEAADSSAAALASPHASTAAGQPGAAAAAPGAANGGAKPLPHFLQSAMAGTAKPAQAAARRPLPPWLKSSMVLQQQQQQQQSPLSGLGVNGMAEKQDEGGWGVKADPEQQLESKVEVKPEATKQEPTSAGAMQEDDDEWEDAVPAGGSTTAVAAAPTVDDDDWEDV